jgi:hypothetical protein
VVIHLWREGRVLWDVKLRGFTGLIEARQVSGGCWRARVLG